MDSQDHDMDLQDPDTYSQDSDMYFTNLINGNSLVNLSDSPPLPSKRSMRGTNFTTKEDELLVSAWLNCSLDAIKGTDQKSSQFWAQIFEYFHEHKETTTEQSIKSLTTERSVKSLTQRWSCIQKATNHFCAYLAQVERLNPSGSTEHTKFEKAKIMYKSIEKCHFQFEHCWRILKDEPKWNSRPTKSIPKQRKTMVPTPTPSPSTTSSPTCNVIDNGVVELDRPMGRKAAKQKRKVESMQTEEMVQIRKMKYTLLEESRVQEKENYRLKAEKMEYDRKVEDEKLRLMSEKMEYDKKIEDEKLRLMSEKMEYDKKVEDERLRLQSLKIEYDQKNEDERLRLRAEKIEFAKKESEQRIMMMDMSSMSQIQRLYFEGLQREIIMRRNLT